MSECCRVETTGVRSPSRCPECGVGGRKVPRLTVKATVRPEALARLSAPEHRFCTTPTCRVVYFGRDEVFGREDLVVPVFQKELPGDRTVCYCFGVTEGDIRQEIEALGFSTASKRIRALVQADRCACEVKNPQGTCCLGNVEVVERATVAGDRVRDHGGASTLPAEERRT